MMGKATETMPELLAQAAWAGFCQWAMKSAEIRARFKTETGNDLDRIDRASPIEAMVDEATGFRADVLRRFVEWATVEIWGLEYAPESYRQDLAKSSTTMLACHEIDGRMFHVTRFGHRSCQCGEAAKREKENRQ